MSRDATEHALRALAAARRLEGAVVVGASAAAVHRLPLVHPLPTLVELSVPTGSWRGITAGSRRRWIPLDVLDIADGQLPVTSIARTWVDVARERPFADALSAGDAVLHRGLTTLDEISRALVRASSLRGVAHACQTVAHLDGRRESPFESWSWAFFLEWRLPLPALQVPIRDDAGRVVARGDFVWEDLAVIGEADGLMKYAPENGGLGAIAREKDREALLRDLGYDVVRWRWSDLAGRPDTVRQRIERALARARAGWTAAH